MKWGQRILSMSEFSLSLARLIRGGYRRIKWLLSDDWTSESRSEGKSILFIYDFNTQPFSVGDILTAQAASLALAKFNGCETVDLAFIYSADNPAIDAPDYKYMNVGEFYFHLMPLITVLQVNPLLRSLFIFDSKKRLEKHIVDNSDRYLVWPTVGMHASGEYLFYSCMNSLFVDHFNLYGNPPYLESSQPTKLWAESFIEDAAHGVEIRISLQIRLNPYNIARNSVIPAWGALFQKLEQLKIHVIFFVVCGLNELPKEWVIYKNVVLVKLNHTSLEQDLAVIGACDYHMGASSGPAMVAILGSKPYRLYGYDGDESRLRCLVNEFGRQRFSFSAPNQYLLRRREDADILLADVLEMTDISKRLELRT